jgi:hypothetical protein
MVDTDCSEYSDTRVPGAVADVVGSEAGLENEASNLTGHEGELATSRPAIREVAGGQLLERLAGVANRDLGVVPLTSRDLESPVELEGVGAVVDHSDPLAILVDLNVDLAGVRPLLSNFVDPASELAVVVLLKRGLLGRSLADISSRC